MAVVQPPEGYWRFLNGLPEDVKRCDLRSKNLDEVWSGLKLVVRKEPR